MCVTAVLWDTSGGSKVAWDWWDPRTPEDAPSSPVPSLSVASEELMLFAGLTVPGK